MSLRIEIGNKFIHAKEIYEVQGKRAWAIVNTKSGHEIACVGYYPAWKRYVMFTDAPTVFDSGCLLSIKKFMDDKNSELI